MTRGVAPEKLTLTPDHTFCDPWFNGCIGNDDPMEDGEDTSYGYTRDDISDARIEQLESALRLIATHRAKCHEHDDDMGHERRDFDVEDVILMEHAARIALKGKTK
jgi:hypothetical protein